MAANTSSPAFYRRASFWIAIAVVLPVCVLGTLWLYQQHRLTSELNQLRAAGLPTNGAELNNYYSVPDDEQDTTALWSAAIHAVSDQALHGRVPELPFIGDGEKPVWGEDWPEFENAVTLLAELDKEMALIRVAAEAGGAVRFPVDFALGIRTKLPDTNASRSVERLLELDAHVALRDGDDARVSADILSIFALSDALRFEPCPISQQIRMALQLLGAHVLEDLLPTCRWSDTQLAGLQMAVAKADFRKSLRTGMAGERATMLMELRKLPFHRANELVGLELFRLLDDTVGAPWSEAILRQQQAEKQFAALGNKFTKAIYTPIRSILPSVEFFTRAAGRSEARQRCAIVALAAARHRLQHGVFPDSLSEIASELFPQGNQSPSQPTLDPFSGESLRYLVSETHITIYSVGDDLHDDGGTTRDEADSTFDVSFVLTR